MSKSFSDLKRSRQSLHEKIIEETNKLTAKNDGGNDARFWQPTADKAGNGYAVIRFLPAPKGEDLPFIRVFTHGFQGPGGWYIENSLTTLGKEDPVSEFNSTLWNRGDEAGKDQARAQKRRLVYIANIYVVQDPAKPENDGKVFLFKFGKKIFDKLNDAMNPEFEDEKPINPFDFWEGANFKLKIRKVEGYRNYDKSEFDSVAPLSTDEDMEKIWNAQYSLVEFLDPKNFKSYDELKKKLTRVLTGTSTSSSIEDVEQDAAPQQRVARTKSAPSKEGKSDKAELSYFEKLAKSDLDDELSF